MARQPVLLIISVISKFMFTAAFLHSFASVKHFNAVVYIVYPQPSGLHFKPPCSQSIADNQLIFFSDSSFFASYFVFIAHHQWTARPLMIHIAIPSFANAITFTRMSVCLFYHLDHCQNLFLRYHCNLCQNVHLVFQLHFRYRLGKIFTTHINRTLETPHCIQSTELH